MNVNAVPPFARIPVASLYVFAEAKTVQMTAIPATNAIAVSPNPVRKLLSAISSFLDM